MYICNSIGKVCFATKRKNCTKYYTPSSVAEIKNSANVLEPHEYFSQLLCLIHSLRSVTNSVWVEKVQECTKLQLLCSIVNVISIVTYMMPLIFHRIVDPRDNI